MPASRRIRAPSATSAPPIHEARTGLPSIRACLTSAFAVAVGSVIAWGVRITSRPSVSGSAAAISSAFAYRSGGASPMMSIGLLWLQTAGRTALRRSIVSGLISVSSPPPPMSASVARTPGPPALVTIDSRRPAGPRLLGQDLGDLEQLADRVDPQHARPPEGRVEDVVGAGERARVDAAAFAAWAVRPGLMTMIGFVIATSRAADRNARASPMVSM